MQLTPFFTGLFTTGKVVVEGRLSVFSTNDEQAVINLLQKIYEQDIQEMPGTAPVFYPEAALWAASYFYNAVQFTVIRDLEADEMKTYLAPFKNEKTHAAIYSADLVLRHMPILLKLAKGLAPADVLLSVLQQTMVEWPFSAAGLLNDKMDFQSIFLHPSLKAAFIDRIIRQKDGMGTKLPLLINGIREALGKHTDYFWPDYELITTNNEQLIYDSGANKID